MSSHTFHNPNGRIYQVNPASTPGTTRKFLGIVLIVACFFLFAPWNLLILPVSLLLGEKTPQSIENNNQAINEEKANEEKAVKTRTEAEMILKNITDEYQKKKSIIDALYDKHQVELSKKLTDLENREAELNNLDEKLDTELENKKQKQLDAFKQPNMFEVTASLQKEKDEIIQKSGELRKQLLEIKNKELPQLRSLISYPEDLYSTSVYIKAKKELNIAEEAMASAKANYQTTESMENNARNNIVALKNKEIKVKSDKKNQTQAVLFASTLGLIGMGFGVLMLRSGNRAARDVEGKNPNYVINSIKDEFYLPYEDYPLCKLSDISTVNKRTETERNRVKRTEYVNGKRKERYRTEIEHTYYVQIIGAGITEDFEFDEQGERDALYSSLKTGIKEVNDFIRRNYF
jgi:hypothetical protein